jgi:hypothetical protein
MKVNWQEYLQPKILIQILTLALAVLGFLHAQRVYQRQKRTETEALKRSAREREETNRLNQFQKFQEMQKRYREDASIQAVMGSLYPDQYASPPAAASIKDKLTFMGFYEEVAMMVRANIIKPSVAYWTLGLDAATFWDQEMDWHDDDTWWIFNQFAQEAKAYYEARTIEKIRRMTF